ncbi:jg5234 [Pararge aegeria aegeria]|uniref:Jg5234 protein n=1 Tax=Pararge aegeria aegeria TaxID=348720 RepID=A0A8S4RCE9_9NEOP|nr:jg5234 [Pararge aegeria aegeria]
MSSDYGSRVCAGHPSRRENEFKKPAHALNGRVHHRTYPYNKSEGLSSTGATAHRPPPLRLPNGVQSQEMKSLPTPLSVIAATPRKELENKFIFNHFTNRVGLYCVVAVACTGFLARVCIKKEDAIKWKNPSHL